ncbi:MAG: hypothetical protein ABT940_06035 [Alphaproteobacteria bacterium]
MPHPPFLERGHRPARVRKSPLFRGVGWRVGVMLGPIAGLWVAVGWALSWWE